MSSTNRLAGESSLYLRQHAANPVDWFPWGREAIEIARETDRPIFLSIGYSACHWCHVMERESFENDAVAEIMNEHFVNVKVDREERPDLDQIYMTAHQMLTREGGGWPLSVFLTPDLTPFYAGTYFPPDDRYGRPGFKRVLLAVAHSWDTKREQLKSVGTQVADALKHSLAVTSDEGELNEQTLRNALAVMKRNYDPIHGGFGRAPKFPHPVDLRLLLRLHHRFGDAGALNMVTHTLTMMARGGIYDQIGGGFHRYSVDEKWLVPHFEKMLYDNALLAPAYLDTDRIVDSDFFRTIVSEILDYVRREMTSPAGGFYSTQDADSEGEEGKFFVWSEDELKKLLGDDYPFAQQVWRFSEHGNFEGHNIAFRCRADAEDTKALGLSLEAFRAKFAVVQQILFGARGKRIKPGRDEKILTAWNGLMAAAFANAATIDVEYLKSAAGAVEFILKTLRTSDGRLLRTCGDGQPAKLAAYLEDYTYVIDALLALYEADFDAKWIATACELADIMIREYYDAEQGGFFITLKDQTDVIARAKDWHDGSTPSGNGVAASVLFKLAILCDRPDYRDAAEKTLHAFRGQVSENPQAAAQMLMALDFQLGPVREVAVFGRMEDPETSRALSAIHSQFQPRQVLAFHDPSQGEPPANIALLRGKTMIDNRVTMYLCRNYQCDAPVVGAAAIIAALA